MKGNLLFVSPSAYSLGGLATWLKYLIPGLEGKGWNVVLGLTSGRFHNVKRYLETHPFESVVEIKNQTGTREGRIRSLCKAILDVQPDLVIVVNIPDTYAAIKRLRTKNVICPMVVMTLHGIQPDFYEDAKEFHDTTDAVICTNRLACRLVQEDAGINPNRVHYASYGIKIPAEGVKRVFRNGPLRIAYSGRLDGFQKRITDIPKILETLDSKSIPYELLIAGGGPAEGILKEKLALKRLSKNVRFFGVLPYHDLVEQVYNQADILLVTSSWETGPIVIWEAMANEMSVVTSSYVGSGLEGNLKHGENCLMFPVGDFVLASECLANLKDLSMRKKISIGGYEMVAMHYSRDRSIEYWDQSFQKILLSPPRRPIAKTKELSPSGRLDRLLGFHLAESVRQLVGKEFIHREAGGEWPHSYGIRNIDDISFWELARSLDSNNPSQSHIPQDSVLNI